MSYHKQQNTGSHFKRISSTQPEKDLHVFFFFFLSVILCCKRQALCNTISHLLGGGQSVFEDSRLVFLRLSHPPPRAEVLACAQTQSIQEGDLARGRPGPG